MYVCLCHGLTDRQIRAAASDGAGRPSEIFRHFEAKPRCGKCVPALCCLLEQSLCEPAVLDRGAGRSHLREVTPRAQPDDPGRRASSPVVETASCKVTGPSLPISMSAFATS
jgi:bacterioferritin-associated ferredoxin